MPYCSECGSGNEAHQPWCSLYSDPEENAAISDEAARIAMEFAERTHAHPGPHALPGDNAAGVHRSPNTLFIDAIQRSLGWASETELRDIVLRYTGVKMSLGECNRFSQEVAEIVIRALCGKEPVAKVEICNAPNGQHPTVKCTLPKVHRGLHRVQLGPKWQTPARRGRCPHLNDKHEQCALPIDHWCAHRNWDGYQFSASEAHLIEENEVIATDGSLIW